MNIDNVQALYWYFADNHDGQWTDTYQALCEIGEIYSPGACENGPEKDSMAESIYDSLDNDSAMELWRKENGNS